MHIYNSDRYRKNDSLNWNYFKDGSSSIPFDKILQRDDIVLLERPISDLILPLANVSWNKIKEEVSCVQLLISDEFKTNVWFCKL